MTMPYRAVLVLLLILPLPFLASRTVEAQVPTPADFASCNEEAPQAIKAGGSSPTKGDHARAESARDTAAATKAPDPEAKALESPDPQVHGMAAEGAKTATYQAAYRSCMRRKGF